VRRDGATIGGGAGGDGSSIERELAHATDAVAAVQAGRPGAEQLGIVAPRNDLLCAVT